LKGRVLPGLFWPPLVKRHYKPVEPYGGRVRLAGTRSFKLSFNQPWTNWGRINRKGRRVGLHAFRHTLASMLLQSTGVAVAQRQLRHSDASTTLGHYEHILGNDHREAVEAVEGALSSSTVTES
jgi:integrase